MQRPEQLEWLGEIGLRRIVAVHTEAVGVRQAVVHVQPAGLPGPGWVDLFQFYTLAVHFYSGVQRLLVINPSGRVLRH